MTDTIVGVEINGTPCSAQLEVALELEKLRTALAEANQTIEAKEKLLISYEGWLEVTGKDTLVKQLAESQAALAHREMLSRVTMDELGEMRDRADKAEQRCADVVKAAKFYASHGLSVPIYNKDGTCYFADEPLKKAIAAFEEKNK